MTSATKATLPTTPPVIAPTGAPPELLLVGIEELCAVVGDEPWTPVVLGAAVVATFWGTTYVVSIDDLLAWTGTTSVVGESHETLSPIAPQQNQVWEVLLNTTSWYL